MASARLTKKVFHWHLGFLQDQGTGGRTSDPHFLLFRTGGDTREILLDDKGGEFLSIDLGINDKDIGKTELVIHCFSPVRR